MKKHPSITPERAELAREKRQLERSINPAYGVMTIPVCED